ncbi:hypothetical protein QJS04_geneDACA019233 [Acorus gramineus]|uniref:G-patch domain-containing protein n=1 Tax=Acorus gramineus TaxID=55184 RepID=A0AAV8ZYZ0_ACOGR|nr:hypothetical protein QJS04_geneDACA019233 [Acorus gramineus]
MGEKMGSSSVALDSSNKGFQVEHRILLKKSGWKEGTGLGVLEQGRLEPLETHMKKNKRGIGAEKVKKNVRKLPEDSSSNEQNKNVNLQNIKKPKSSKRIRKMLEEDARMKEREFEQAFFREFWPDNV